VDAVVVGGEVEVVGGDARGRGPPKWVVGGKRNGCGNAVEVVVEAVVEVGTVVEEPMTTVVVVALV